MKQVLYFLSLGVFLHSCKSKETVTPNRPPSSFTVTQTLKSDGKTIVLNWTKAKDPDGDALTYTVVLKDTLVKNVSDTTYTIVSLDFNYSQKGKIIAKDAKGLTSEVSFTATTKAVTFVNIPDANFEKYLVEQKIDKDSLVNGRMNVEDARGVTKINVEAKAIKNLAGIEVFVDLEEFRAGGSGFMGYNSFTTLDISKNVALKTFICVDNSLTSLDVSKNIALTTLVVTNNKLTTLDISKNTALQTLACDLNRLTTLDVSKNIALQTMYCYSNQITNLDVSNNTSLIKLSCFGNLIGTLDISKNTALQSMYCYSNQLTNLDVSKNVLLTTLLCYSNKIQVICTADIIKANSNTNWQKDPTAKYEVCK